MGNSKKFIIPYHCTTIDERDKFLKIVKDEVCVINTTSNPKFLTWLHYLDALILITANDTYWDTSKLNKRIHELLSEKSLNPSYLVIEITGMKLSGYMTDKFWKDYKNFDDINQYVDDRDRVKKLKKIKFLMDQKEEIKKREDSIKRKELELKKKEEDLMKELERKKVLDELKRKEDELKEKEKDLDKKLTEAKSWWKTLLKI